ncbi:hypothetical protein [Odoribacter laneus]|uniref:hypothetical protein n=1 Tax=Odoribacter laneus TaxID=626933 RepID=UPI003AB2B3A9
MKLNFIIGFLCLSGIVSAQSLFPKDSLKADFREFIKDLEETHPDPYTAFGGKVFYPSYPLSYDDYVRYAFDQETELRYLLDEVLE